MSTDDVTAEQDATPDPATWDPQAWLAGASSTVRSITVYGRGDLVAAMDELRARIREAERTAVEDRALGEASPQGLYEQAEDMVRAFQASALTIRVEGRSEARLRAIDKRLRKDRDVRNDDDGEQTLAYLADAIVSPAGLDAGWLRQFRETSWAQYVQLANTFTAASGAPPAVTVPFSRAGSRDRKQPASD